MQTTMKIEDKPISLGYYNYLKAGHSDRQEYDLLLQERAQAHNNLEQARNLVRGVELDCRFYDSKIAYLKQKLEREGCAYE